MVENFGICGISYVHYFHEHIANHKIVIKFVTCKRSQTQQVGIIHVVEKKQKTVKISPLIVSPDYRGKLGVGSMLLEHAENFARGIGARQLYCTVASPNKKALELGLPDSLSADIFVHNFRV